MVTGIPAKAELTVTVDFSQGWAGGLPVLLSETRTE